MAKTNKIIIGVIIAIIVIGGIWYSLTKKPADEEIIKIGAILPLTGNAMQYGEDSRKGIDLAVDEINNAGGINGKKIQIIYEDSLGDARNALDSYKKLSEIDNLKIYLTTLSNVSLSIGPVAQIDKNLLFVIGSASPAIAKTGDFVFRNNVDTAIEAEKMAEFAFYTLGIKTIAIYTVNSDAGQSYNSSLKDKFESLGGRILFSENYQKGYLDHKTPLTKIKSLSPEAIYVFGHTSDVSTILKQMEEIGIDTQVLSATGVISSKLKESVGNEIIDGIIYTDPTYSKENEEGLSYEFNKRFLEKYGHEAEYFSALGYDNVKILFEVMKNCDDPTNASCVRDGLFKINYQGVTGETSFNEIGDARKSIVFKMVKDGEFVPYEE